MKDSETLGATPADDESGLLQKHLKTRSARDAAELESIARAYDNYVYKARRRFARSDWLSDSFIRETHRQMFGEIWDWAGTYRTQPMNLGVAPKLIHEQVGQLCGDFKFWNSAQCKMSKLEIAARLQNRLTRIHPFRNGNGRHARLMSDIYLASHRHKFPVWPQIQLITTGHEIRVRYIEAMKAADQEDYRKLIRFMEEHLPQ